MNSRTVSKLIPLLMFIFLIGCTRANDVTSEWINTNYNEDEIQTLFSNWDKGEIEGSEKSTIMNALADSIRKNPQFTTEEVEVLSNYISVIEVDDLRVIQYIENPEYYGASARESYQLVVYGDQTELMDQKESIRIEDIIKRDEHLYYVYATDYRMSNMTGVQIFNIEIDDRMINQSSLINIKGLAERFIYDDENEVLYFEDGHIYFKKILDQGEKALIAAGDSDYVLQLGEDELYYVSSTE